MTHTEALRLALEALENASNAIESWGSYASEYFQDKHDLQGDINNTQQAITAIKAALEAKDEPVAWISHNAGLYHFKPDESLEPLPLYLAPPQRKPLTDEEIVLIVAECAASHQHTDIHFARAIEAKLKEKNT